jgi:hypothetical protein
LLAELPNFSQTDFGLAEASNLTSWALASRSGPFAATPKPASGKISAAKRVRAC